MRYLQLPGSDRYMPGADDQFERVKLGGPAEKTEMCENMAIKISKPLKEDHRF